MQSLVFFCKISSALLRTDYEFACIPCLECATNAMGAEYGRAAYEQGFKDSVKLLLLHMYSFAPPSLFCGVWEAAT